MSDYLDNLVNRSLNLKEVVQPRPISLFEPLPGTAWPPPGPLTALEMAERETVSGEQAFESLQAAPRAAGRPLASPFATSPGTEPGYLSDSLAISVRRARSSAGQQPLTTTALETDETGPEPPRIQPGPDSGPPTCPPIPGIPVQPEPAMEHTVIERIVSLAAPPPTQAVSLSTEAAPRRRPPELESRTVVRAALPQTGPAAATPVVARPQVRPYPEPGLPSAASPAAKPEPTIQVTIGRIEVRATPAASPPKKQTPTAPMLSLADYLRQRNGGAR